MKPSSQSQSATPSGSANRRISIWYALLLLVVGVFILRLFYLDIVRHDHYRSLAMNDQLKQYSIQATRGIIQAHDGNSIVPLVLNEKLYTLFADPTFVDNADTAANKLAVITKGDASQYSKLIKTKDTRYVVLANKLSTDQHAQIDKLNLKGVGTRETTYRTYPESTLGSQLLGFVNNDGKGTYGIEQALNKQLSGSPGLLKAITDASGVPLVASKDNIQVNPTAGKNVVLTVDVAMQQQLEEILKNSLKNAKSNSGSALIMDPNTGAIKAMANFPTYDPSQYYKVADANVFNNAAVSTPLEVGSIMKALTAAAALDQHVVNQGTTYYDPAKWDVDGYTIKNIEEDGGAGTRSVADILNLSLNTGATWLLMQMGGGQINQKARSAWHDYMVNHYQFGKPTGVEQGYEATGYIPNPDKGYGLDLTYANTAFGQAMTATPLQMAAAFSSILNGGVYYKPYLVDQTVDASGKATVNKPKVINHNVVSPAVSESMQQLLEFVVAEHHIQPGFSSAYSVGGKTGTAQIANPKGGYYEDKFNGTYMGFVGGDAPQYVIMVDVNQPAVGGYAGTAAAQPLFANLAHMLINNFNVTPKS